MIFGTILLAVIIYFAAHFPVPLKQLIVDYGLKKTKEQLNLLQGTEQDKMAMVDCLKKYSEAMLQSDSFSLDRVSIESDRLEKILQDSVITEEKSQNFVHYIEKVIIDEGRTKN